MSSDGSADGAQYVFDAMGGMADGEPIVRVQWGRPLGSTERGHGGVGRAVGRLFGRGDGLTGIVVIAVTETRLLLLAAEQGWGGMKVGEVLGQWRLGGVRLGGKDRTATTEYDRTDTTVRKVRTKLTVVAMPDGRKVELPQGAATTALVEAVNDHTR